VAGIRYMDPKQEAAAAERGEPAAAAAVAGLHQFRHELLRLDSMCGACCGNRLGGGVRPVHGCRQGAGYPSSMVCDV
jgi:hypothetical protein